MVAKKSIIKYLRSMDIIKLLYPQEYFITMHIFREIYVYCHTYMYKIFTLHPRLQQIAKIWKLYTYEKF